MYEFSLKDIAAYKVVDQMISHMWGGAKWEERDLMCVYKLFFRRHGSWVGIMEGDSSQFELLEKTICDYMNYRELMKAAHNISI